MFFSLQTLILKGNFVSLMVNVWDLAGLRRQPPPSATLIEFWVEAHDSIFICTCISMISVRLNITNNIIM